MRQKIVAGNWKMNMLLPDGLELMVQLSSLKPSWPDSVKVIVAPPAIYLSAWSHSEIALAAQDCSAHDKGAYTGEISAAQLSSAGIAYALVGHSERRTYHQESNESLALKVKQCLANSVTPIFCFGEELAQREAGEQETTVKTQLSEVLFGLSKEEMSKVILAYEPVWAIGTGKTATAAQAQEMHAYVRSLIAEQFRDAVAQDVSILYGGSCKPSNAKEIFAGPDVDGGLIGGASLKAEDFTAIIKARA